MANQICYLFGHSFPARLERLARDRSVSAECLCCLPLGMFLRVRGFSGLTFSRVLADPNRYLQCLTREPIRTLCIDLGTNDLCNERNRPSDVVQQAIDLLGVLHRMGVRPRRIIFFSVIQRSSINRPGQISIRTFNHRVRRYNSYLSRALRSGYPNVGMYMQRRISHPRHLVDGCHLSERAMNQYVTGIKEVLLRPDNYMLG